MQSVYPQHNRFSDQSFSRKRGHDFPPSNASSKKPKNMKVRTACVNCGRMDHSVRNCRGPTSREGFIHACPACHHSKGSPEGQYLLDECPKVIQANKTAERKTLYHFAVASRKGKPPLKPPLAIQNNAWEDLATEHGHSWADGVPLSLNEALRQSEAKFYLTFDYEGEELALIAAAVTKKEVWQNILSRPAKTTVSWVLYCHISFGFGNFY